MFKRNAMGNTRTKIIAGAVLLAIGFTAAGSAMSTDVFGGGATLPAGAYVGFNFNVPTTPAKLSTNATTNHLDPSAPPALAPVGVASDSLFGAWATSASNKVSYCQTGSGNGKKIFDHTDGVSTSLLGSDFCTGASIPPASGFGASLTAQADPHFAGSDAPMSQTEYGWFLDPTKGNKAGKYTQPVEFPAVVGSIAIIMNNDNLATPVALTDAKVCQIFNGQVTTWTGLGLPKPSNGVDTFNLAYRSDGSGTTFSLVNHLANVCGSVGSNHFVTDQSFATSVAQFYTAPAAPSGRFFPANGNPLVVKAVASNAGTIGYSEAANFKNVAAANPQIHYATVNGFDPFDNLPNSITLPVVTDRGISGVNASGVATTAALTPIAQTGCINLVEPSTYATSTTRYPIVAVSYLIANNTGNGTDLAAVQGLVGAPYNTAIRPNVHTIGNSGVAGQGTGFAYVATLPSISSKTTTCIKI